MSDTASDTAQELDAAQPNRRRLKNFFSKPRYQLKYTNYFVGGGLLFIAVTAAFIQYQLAEVDALLNSEAAMGLGGQAQVYDALAGVAQIAFIGFAGFVAYACVLALVMSHRIAGPMIALVDIIEEYKKGNYGYSRALRRRDELVPIHEALSELAMKLRNDK